MLYVSSLAAEEISFIFFCLFVEKCWSSFYCYASLASCLPDVCDQTGGYCLNGATCEKGRDSPCACREFYSGARCEIRAGELTFVLFCFDYTFCKAKPVSIYMPSG